MTLPLAQHSVYSHTLGTKRGAKRNVQRTHSKTTGLLKNTYIRHIKALSLFMLTAQVGGTTNPLMREAPVKDSKLTSMMKALCKADSTEADELQISAAMKKDWFRANEANCGSYTVASTGGSAKLAVHFEDELCQAMDELIAFVANEPECDSLQKICKTEAGFEEVLIPGVINTQGFSASLSASSLEPCIAKMATVTAQCGQSYENSDKQSMYQIFIWTLASLAVLGTIVGEELTKFFTDQLIETYGFDIDFQRSLNRDLGRFNLIADSFAVSAAILKPLIQAMCGQVVGGEMVKLLAESASDASTINPLDGELYVLLGALPFALDALMKVVPELIRSQAANQQHGRLYFMKELTDLQRGIGFHIRNVAPILGVLSASQLGMGKQTGFETVANMGAAQLLYPLLGPVLYFAAGTVQVGLTDIAEFLQHKVPQLNQAVRELHLRMVQAAQVAQARLVAQRTAQVQPSWGDIFRSFQINHIQLLLPFPRESVALNSVEQKINRLETLRGNQLSTSVEDLVPSYLESLFICSLTRELMRDPVGIPAGDHVFVYERSAAQYWIDREQCHPTIRSVQIPANQTLDTVFAIKSAIEFWLDSEIERAERA